MSYPSGTALTYTAVAATVGVSHSFTYEWSFDDGGTASTATASHTWSTDGQHTATVTATDTTTLGTASASKTVRVSSSWTVDTPVIPAYTSNFRGPTTVELLDGTILIIGSRTDNNTAIGNTSYVYNPLTHTITSVGNLPASRIYTSGESAVRLNDGRVLCTGCYISGSSNSIETKRTYIYDPSTQVWSETGLRNYPSEYGGRHTSVLLSDGRVFSASTNSSFLKNEIFDPTTGAWTVLPDQPVATAYNAPSVCLMADGRVFRGPGVNDTSNKCVAWTSSTNSWETLTDCPVTQLFIVSAPDGTLLGITLGTPTPNYYIYTPSTNTWSTALTGPTIPTPSGYPNLFVRGDEILYTRGSTSVASFKGGSWSAYPTLNATHPGAYLVIGAGVLCCVGSTGGNTSIEYL